MVCGVKFYRGGLDFEEVKALFWHWIVPIFKNLPIKGFFGFRGGGGGGNLTRSEGKNKGREVGTPVGAMAMLNSKKIPGQRVPKFGPNSGDLNFLLIGGKTFWKVKLLMKVILLLLRKNKYI